MIIGNLYIDLVSLAILVILAFYVERRGWVARWTVIANGVIVLGSLFPNFAGSIVPSPVLPPVNSFPDLLQWWAWGALLAAIAIGLDYFNKLDVPQQIKKWIQRVYSSKTLLGIFIAAMFNIFQYWWVCVLAVWLFATYKLGHEF